MALPITLTDDSAIAAAAMMGESRMPKNGYSTPAATGTPIASDGAADGASALVSAQGWAAFSMTVAPHDPRSHRCTARSRSALPMTLTDERAMAAAAMMGDSRMPNVG